MFCYEGSIFVAGSAIQWLRDKLKFFKDSSETNQLYIKANKNNVYDNVASTLIKIGGRMGNLMDTTQQAMSPDSQMGKEISKKEKDQIYKAINEVEEKIAKLKLSVK